MMTKEGILEMQAGNQLDVLVHREVFGVKVELCSTCEKYHAPIYSTDISAAWQVVDKMRGMTDSKGNQLLCCLNLYCDVPGDAWVIHWAYSELSIMDDDHKDHKLPLSWFSLPEAICKAALLTKLEARSETTQVR